MRNYLSFGGGVNSVALLLHLHEQEENFEAVFVNHGTDWPETYKYFDMLQSWLQKQGFPIITELKPIVQGSKTLYEHCWKKRMVPSFMSRWCTDKFKRRPLHKYFQAPAFTLLAFDAGEAKRARFSSYKGCEMRYPLIEAGINRQGCKEIIKSNGLPLPMKSGCFICPFQRVTQWKELRRNHPDLFCKAEKLEERNIQHRLKRGKPPLYLNMSPAASLRAIVDEKQIQVFAQDEYPPCYCAV